MKPLCGKKSISNPRGYMLGAGCNCFPHFLWLVKLIHYQRQTVMPRAWQWACFLWVFWHFFPCNSQQKAIKQVINLCIRKEKAFWGFRHSLTWLKVFLFEVLTSALTRFISLGTKRWLHLIFWIAYLQNAITQRKKIYTRLTPTKKFSLD